MTTLDCVEPAARFLILPEPDRKANSRWVSVTQSQIDAFAAVTGDQQWIHQGNAQEAGSPFNGPIAHGLLLLGLAINLARECGALEDVTWVLYGFEKVRFRAPVHCGARIRCLTTVNNIRQLAAGTLVNVRFVMEIENAKIPALVADCLLLNLSTSSGHDGPTAERVLG
jgi:acyl dehydratase